MFNVSDLAFGNLLFRQGRLELQEEDIPNLGVDIDSDDELLAVDDSFVFPDDEVEVITNAPRGIIDEVFEVNPENTTTTTISTSSTTRSASTTLSTTASTEITSLSSIPPTTTTKVTTTSATTIASRTTSPTSSVSTTTTSQLPSSTTTPALVTTRSTTLSVSTTAPTIRSRVGIEEPGYSPEDNIIYDDDYREDVNVNNVESEGNTDTVNIGPRSLSLCVPLTRVECGLMGDTALWQEFLTFIEVMN